MTKVVGIYTHSKPNGEIFYVGKGTMRRAKNFHRPNKFYNDVVAYYGKENIIVNFWPCKDDADAFEQEIELIEDLRSMGIRLTNKSIGGSGGCSGVKLTAQHKECIARAQRGRQKSKEHREKLSKAVSVLMEDPSFRQLLSIRQTERLKNPELRASISRQFKGKKLSLEHKRKMSQTHLKRYKNPELRRRVSEGMKRVWEQRKRDKENHVS